MLTINFETSLSKRRLDNLRNCLVKGPQTKQDLADLLNTSLTMVSYYMGHLIRNNLAHVSSQRLNHNLHYVDLYSSGPAPAGLVVVKKSNKGRKPKSVTEKEYADPLSFWR